MLNLRQLLRFPNLWPALGFASLYALSLGLLMVAAANRWALWVVGAAVLLAVTSIVLNLRLRTIPATSLLGWILRFGVPTAMVLVGVFLIVQGFGKRTDGLGFFGGCLLFLGIGQLLTLWRSSECGAVVRGLVVVALCAAAFAVGLAVLSDGTSTWATVLLAEGILASPIGLSLLSEDALQKVVLGASRRRLLVLAFTGAVLATAGVALLVWLAGMHLDYAVLLGVAVALLVGAIASDTPADVLIVVAVIALGWAVSPRGVSPDDPVLPEQGETVLVALGDSFMSGEGANEFYNGTNNRRENECRRAPSAYAPEVVRGSRATVPADLAFVACSGAKAVNLYQDPQYPGEPIGGPTRTDKDGKLVRGLPQLAHLAWLIRDQDIKVELVIVSVGGNDALFGEIVKSCIGPGDCSRIGQRWLDNLTKVAPLVDRAYQEIRDHVGEIPVLVVPYPIPLDHDGCPGSLFVENEHRFLQGFVGQLNEVLRRAARDAGLHYLDRMPTALQARSLRLCDVSPGKAGVNYIGLNPVDGLIEQRLNPTNWLHNSLHPNPDGHQAMAAALAQWLRDHPNLGPRPEPSRELGPPSIATVEVVMDDDDFEHCGTPKTTLPLCDRTPNDWAVAQAARSARRAVPPLLVVIAGTWILWLLAIRWWRTSPRAAQLRDRVATRWRRLTGWGGLGQRNG